MVTKQAASGVQGEELVAQMLERKGFAIVERNYRKSFGEIDLIAADSDTILFVEVKLRTSNCIDLAELIGLSKQKKIGKAIRAYLSETGSALKLCRCDVALVDKTSGRPQITYIEDAFQIEEGY